MSVPAKSSARRVQEALEAAGLDLSVVELPQSARTARDAAIAIGCTVAQIAKSLVFKGAESGSPYLVVASGVNRVDVGRLSNLADERVAMAEPEFVRAATGYAIGGVPPVGHATAIRTWIDADLLQFDEIWAAAGTPSAVFRLTPQALIDITGGELANTAG
ncbi:MAG: YbaK/EbsC family protein [Rhodothermales bacterium]|nr:YbaK/EbsC family protein [Rhodothermales bacterium]